MPRRSAAANTFRLENLESLTKNDEVKFVITNREDYDFSRDFIRKYALHEKAGRSSSAPPSSRYPAHNAPPTT